MYPVLEESELDLDIVLEPLTHHSLRGRPCLLLIRSGNAHPILVVSVNSLLLAES